MLPVHVVPKPKDNMAIQLPPDNICYMVGVNGIFKRTNNDFYEVIEELKGIPNTASIDKKSVVKVLKLPYEIVEESAAIFAAIYKRQQSEALVILYAHPQYGWHVDAPKQEAIGLHVDYDFSTLPIDVQAYFAVYKNEEGKDVQRVFFVPEEIPEGAQVTEFKYLRFGTIHSHASAAAFHSGTDDKDEVGFDGLHITIGNVDVPAHTYSARWQLAGKFYQSTMHDVAEDPAEGFFDERWLSRVTKKAYTQSTAGYAGGSPTGPSSRQSDTKYYGHGGGYHGGGYGMGDGWGLDGPDNSDNYYKKGGDAGTGGTFRGNETTKEAAAASSAISTTLKHNSLPVNETRLRLAMEFIQAENDVARKAMYDRLDTSWKDQLVEDLAEFYPVQSANFLKGLGAECRRSTASASDTSPKSGASETGLTTSPLATTSQSAPMPNVAQSDAEDPWGEG